MRIGKKDLLKLYKNPLNEGSLGGVNKFYKSLKEKGYNISKEKVKQWLAEDDTYQLHKPKRKKFLRRSFNVNGMHHLWQADLSDLSSIKTFNKGNKFLLFVIDAFSKFAWVRPLKDKSGAAIKEAMQSILDESSSRPLNLQTDKGGEFENRHFKDLMRSKNINFYTSQNEETKAAFVERLQRTYKSKMYRYFTHNRSLSYLDVLQDLMISYNNTVHSTTGMKPVDVTRQNEHIIRKKLCNKKIKKKRKKEYEIGDNVRLADTVYAFGKGYWQQWTEEIFIIHEKKKTEPITYKVKDQNNEIIEGSFYHEELQKVPKVKDRQYFVEKVLKTRKRGKKKQLFVKWAGYPDSFNQWIWEDDYV